MHSTLTTRRAFTIIEIMVVVGIIALLIAILVPTLAHVRNNATLAVARAQIEGLQSALQTYYSDHNTYPPSHIPSGGPRYGSISPGMGSVMLAQGLMGFLPKPADGAGPPSGGGQGVTVDEPLYGFRTRNSQMGGKIYGPYVDPTRAGYTRLFPGTTEYFVDGWNHDILYYCSRGAPTVSPASIFGYNENSRDSFFWGGDNLIVQNGSRAANEAPGTPQTLRSANPTLAQPAFMKLIYSNADTSPNLMNRYNGGVVIGQDSYLLISAGPDEQYLTGDDIIVSKP